MTFAIFRRPAGRASSACAESSTNPQTQPLFDRHAHIRLDLATECRSIGDDRDSVGQRGRVLRDVDVFCGEERAGIAVHFNSGIVLVVRLEAGAKKIQLTLIQGHCDNDDGWLQW